MSFLPDTERVRRPVIIRANPAAAGTDPQTQRHCKCKLARGVWIDCFSGVRCDLCNLKIRDWEKS